MTAAFRFGSSLSTGTWVKFNPPTGTDTMLKGGVSTSISTRHQYITAMLEYQNKSFEEIRYEDYLKKKRKDDIYLLHTDSLKQRSVWKRYSNGKQVKKGEFALSAKTDASTQTETELRGSKLPQGLKEMLLSSKLSDFVLSVQGKEFKVHKVILAAHSPVFAAMMEHDTKEKASGIANIEDFDPLTISKFLDFLYTAKVENLNSDLVMDLYKVADKYQVKELCDLCLEYMINNVSVENFCDILNLSLRHFVWQLTEVATQFFLKNAKEIAVSPKWGEFLSQNPVVGNELFLKTLKLENK